MAKLKCLLTVYLLEVFDFLFLLLYKKIADWATQAFFRYGSATVLHPITSLANASGQPIQAPSTRLTPDTSFASQPPAPGSGHSGSYLATPGIRQAGRR